VRSFKVGGIKGLLDNSPNEFVTIQTAVQVALELQLLGVFVVLNISSPP